MSWEKNRVLLDQQFYLNSVKKKKDCRQLNIFLSSSTA